MDEAFVTLATTDRYALGALVLAASLADAGTTRQKVVMVTQGVSREMRSTLSESFDLLFDVSEFDSGDSAHLALLRRPDLGVTFTKLHCWRLTQFSKCVFLDADTLVLQNCDELFQRGELSAAPDAGWPDCFNSGVFVFVPSMDTFWALVRMAETEGSFDGGDQGLLNAFFSTWATEDIAKHLSFTYNMTATAFYTYLPALARFGRSVKTVHFIGAEKPWSAALTAHGEPASGQQHLSAWWSVFHAHVRDRLTASDATAQLAPPMISASGQPLGPPRQRSEELPRADPEAASSSSAAEPASDSREAWEVGHPDFMGTAKFDNILKKLDESVSSPSSPAHDN